MDNPVIIYHTEGCHLCEQAAALLNESGHPYQPIDIVNDDTLVERYGVRIPVVRRGDDELGWPFDLKQLQQFLGAR